jgi:hypothetical protein
LSGKPQKTLQNGYTEQIVPVQQYRAEAAMLERELSDLVNAAYGLTQEEVALLWATAPPRMPLLPSYENTGGKLTEGWTDFALKGVNFDSKLLISLQLLC